MLSKFSNCNTWHWKMILMLIILYFIRTWVHICEEICVFVYIYIYFFFSDFQKSNYLQTLSICTTLKQHSTRHLSQLSQKKLRTGFLQRGNPLESVPAMTQNHLTVTFQSFSWGNGEYLFVAITPNVIYWLSWQGNAVDELGRFNAITLTKWFHRKEKK